MNRRELRQSIFKLIFRIEFFPKEELNEQFEEELLNMNAEEKDKKYIRVKTNLILEHLEEIDEKILSICQGWRIERLGKCELAILRLAVYEALMDDDIPVSVAINEAVELTKIYCSEDAPRFINGVLAKIGMKK